ncbi:MAG: TlpA family protein disulfide reductase [Acidobacteriales bacterium]|nr:TlpA family protein disulfide reductase [Terriglobales bacterium]
MRRGYIKSAIFLVFVLAGCQRGSTPDLVGRPAPDFTVRDADRSVTLSQFRGKTVVLNFWATWCPPCVEEMPSLVAMQKKLKDQVVVLAVSTDESETAYKKFIVDRGITPTVLTVRDGQQVSNSLYGTFRYPETYVIDASGVLRRKFIGPVDWTKPEILEYLTKL